MDRKQLSLNSIRNSLEIFGHNTSKISDEELENGVHILGKVIRDCGISTEEAIQSLSSLNKRQ